MPFEKKHQSAFSEILKKIRILFVYFINQSTSRKRHTISQEKRNFF